MFSIKLKMEMAVRVSMIAVILFNALVPTSALAKSLTVQNTLVSSSNNDPKENQNKSESLSSLENSPRQRYVRPTSTRGNRSELLNNSSAQTSDVWLKCVNYWIDYCSDTNPGIVVTQSGDTTVNGDFAYMHFKIVCASWEWGCTNRDIYYRATMEVTYGDPWGSSAEFRATLNAGTLYGGGTGGLNNVLCGYGPSGNCKLQTQGVIPAEIITPNPDDARHFAIQAVAGSVAYTWTHRKVTVQVSLDPSFLDSQVPADASNCKGCYYGQSQGWAADPINTRTGVVSYSMKDMGITTGAGPLTFIEF